MRALVHIGPYKTGSTSIQAALRKNRSTLEAAGVWLPELNPNTLAVPFLPERMVNEFRLPKGVASRADYVPYAGQAWAAIKSELAGNPARLCILSSEHFSAPGMDLPRFFGELNEMFDSVTVLGYVRHPVDHYVSSLGEKVKAGNGLKQIRPSQYRYGISRALRACLDHVPAEQIIARNFSRKNLVGNDAVKDFCAVLGRLGVEVDLPSVVVNESLPGVAVAWLLSVNEAFGKAELREERHALVRRLIRSSALSTLPKPSIADPALRAYLVAGVREECDWVNRTFLTGQIPIELPDDTGAQVDDSTADALLRTWLAGYLTPDAVLKLMAEVERHNTAAATVRNLPDRRLKRRQKVA